MPLQFRDTPFNAETIRRLASPAGTAAARATGNTGQPAGINPFLGRALRNSATSQPRQATSQPRQATSQPGQATYNPLAGRTSQPRQAAPVAAAPAAAAPAALSYRERLRKRDLERTANTIRLQTGRQVDPESLGFGDVANPSWNWGAANRPAPARQTTDISQEPGPSAGRTLLSGGPGGGQATAPAPAPVAAQASPDVPQIGRIAPVRSTAPDPGSPATLARPEAPNVDPLTLPEARQRTVANRSQDLGHLQSARSRRSVQGPRGSFNMADTARRTLLGSL